MAERKTVLITGASSGIGLETARLLGREGFRVFGTRLPAEGFSDPAFETVPLDVTSDESVAACVGAVLEQAGRLDVLYNNAGIGLMGPVEETPLDECRRLFEVNYFGVVRMIRAVLPAMREQRSGLIICTSSVAGYLGVPFEAHYCASKMAIDGLARALRCEAAGFGIDVVVLAPGYVRTPFYGGLRLTGDRIVAYDPARALAERAFEASARAGNDPQVIARQVLRIVRARRPRVRYYGGRDAALYRYFHRFMPNCLLERGMRGKFVPGG